jgi:hypothetical protein
MAWCSVKAQGQLYLALLCSHTPFSRAKLQHDPQESGTRMILIWRVIVDLFTEVTNVLYGEIMSADRTSKFNGISQ